MVKLKFLLQQLQGPSTKIRAAPTLNPIFLDMLGSRRVVWCIGLVLVVAAVGASAEDADQAEQKPSKVKVRRSSLEKFRGGGGPRLMPTSSSPFGRRAPTLTRRVGLLRRC